MSVLQESRLRSLTFIIIASAVLFGMFVLDQLRLYHIENKVDNVQYTIDQFKHLQKAHYERYMR